MILKKILYYLINLMFVFIIVSTSNLLYYKNFKGLFVYIGNNYLNIIAVSIVFFILSYLFELINFDKEHPKDKTFIELFRRLILILFLTLISDFFIFFKSNIGRKAYFISFFLFSIFFLIQNFFHSNLKRKRKIFVIGNKIHKKDLKEYFYPRAIHLIRKNKMNDSSIYNENLLYDDRELKNDEMINLIKMKINGKNIEKLNSYIEREKNIIPLKFIDNGWLLRNIECKNIIERKNSDKILWLFSLIALILFFPLGLLFAQLHKVKSKGPIFYKQERIGKNNQKFIAIKFRTMELQAEINGAQFSFKNDLRKNKVGNFMRKFRIDEIPQLLNVLKGDMNLIGPRPEREVFISKLEKQIPFYRLRLEVKPGITGWAQVNYNYAGDELNDHIKKLEYDLYYIKNKNLILDLLILIKTIKTVFLGKGI